MKSHAFRAAFLAALLPLSCSDTNVGDVSGRVTLDGQPVPSGAITFVPADGKSPTAGGIIRDGSYTARVPVGDMKVTLTAPKVVGKKKIYATADSPEMPVTAELLPARYNTASTLSVVVHPGRNAEVNFDLTSGK